MTFLETRRTTHSFSILLGGLIACVAASAFAVVVMYARVVNARHDLSRARARLDAIETESSSIHDSVFSLLSSDALEAFARDHAFVIDRAPRYLTIDRPWLSLVSPR